MAKVPLDQNDGARPDSGANARSPHMSRVGNVRLAILDKIDEWNLDTATRRSRRGMDIGPQLVILTANYARRRAILGRAS